MIFTETQIIKHLKELNLADCAIRFNLDMIRQERDLALCFSGDTEFDAKIRNCCIQEARRLKEDNDAIKKRVEDTWNALSLLPEKQKQVLEMYYINGIESKVCCDILGCTINQFRYIKMKALQELERILNETYSDL